MRSAISTHRRRSSRSAIFCHHRLDAGQLPACVEACPTGARIIGNGKDPTSEVSRILARRPVQVLKPEHGTEPQVFYEGLDEAMAETRGRRVP